MSPARGLRLVHVATCPPDPVEVAGGGRLRLRCHGTCGLEGCLPGRVLCTRVLVASTDRLDLVRVWDVVRRAFGDHDVPSTLLGVTVLGYPDQLVEVEAVAAVQD